MNLSLQEITRLFTRKDNYLCARWRRPVAPVFFGLADESLHIFKAAIHAVYTHNRHPVIEADPEMGANLMMFFCTDWNELIHLPDLQRLTDQDDLVTRLQTQSTNHYQIFRFEADGAIRACLSFVRTDINDLHPAVLAETLAVRTTLTFAHNVKASAPLARLIRAAYDPVMPDVAKDASHALRLAARLS